MRQWLFPVFATLVAACSSTPAPHEPAGAAPVPAATSTAPTASAGTTANTTRSAAAPQTEVAAGAGSMQVHADQPATATSRPGFRTRTRKGETVFCRNETPTGSRLSVENCYSAIELDQMETAAASMKDSINKTRTPCTGQACNGS